MKEKVKESKNSHIYEYKALSFESSKGILIISIFIIFISFVVLIIENFNTFYKSLLNFYIFWRKIRKNSKKTTERRNEFSKFYSKSFNQNNVKFMDVNKYGQIRNYKLSSLLKTC